MTGINKDEAGWFDANVDLLNNYIKQAVEDVKVSHPGFDIKFVPMDNYITLGGHAVVPDARSMIKSVTPGLISIFF